MSNSFGAKNAGYQGEAGTGQQQDGRAGAVGHVPVDTAGSRAAELEQLRGLDSAVHEDVDNGVEEDDDDDSDDDPYDDGPVGSKRKRRVDAPVELGPPGSESDEAGSPLAEEVRQALERITDGFRKCFGKVTFVVRQDPILMNEDQERLRKYCNNKRYYYRLPKPPGAAPKRPRASTTATGQLHPPSSSTATVEITQS